MLDRLLSHDRPGHRWLAAALVAIALGLLFVPWLAPGSRSLGVAAKIAVFVVLAASYDLVLGYTGIVSFAHTLYFGVGAYGVAIATRSLGPTGAALLAGLAAALAVSLLIALAIALFSLRIKAMFFAMITLAVASVFQTLVSQMSAYTGGDDGIVFDLPRWIHPFRIFLGAPVGGVSIDGQLLAYYLILAIATALFLAMLRLVNSPFGRVLQAIRENEFRAQALGYSSLAYKATVSVLASLLACVAGALLAVWLRYAGPETSLGYELMVDTLLMLVIGGMGTLYGAVLGSALFLLAQNYLQDGLRLASAALADVPLLPRIVSPDRWLLWLGVAFVLSVYYFPSGIIGRLRQPAAERTA